MCLCRILCLIIFLATIVVGSREIFKTCAKVPFCNKFRSYQLSNDQKFKADFDSLNNTEHEVFLTLKNAKNNSLLLVLSWSDHIVRIKINEPDTKRFFLKAGHAIPAEPLQNKLKIEKKNDNQIIIYNSNIFERIVIQNIPEFSAKAYNILNETILTLTADRLYMENAKDSQVFTFSVNFNAPRLYGLFDHSWGLALSETVPNGLEPFRMRNGDPWGYKDNSPMALYGSIPATYGHSDSQTSGIFLHNAAEQWIDIGYRSENMSSAYFVVESAAFDLFIFMGPEPKDVVRQMTNLTGRAPLPQLWTLGYHQCRFSYKSQEDVENVTTLMEINDFPMDAIWLDGDHTDSYRWFRWNKNTFKRPLEMFETIASFNKVVVSISDPHFKVDKDYNVYAEAKDKYFVKWDNGSDYEGRCWPGLSSWIDFLNPEASDYYSSWFAYDKFNGTNPTLAGIWNDMNEPSVYNNSNENTFPYELVHKLDKDGTHVRHKDVHNIYGLMHTQATYQGLLKRDNYTKRPFILTRSHFAGSQRYAAMWTGDNKATWEYFANSFSQCMTGNLLGMVFCGADVGGFFGNTSGELLQRWYQGAAWLPFFRGHSDRNAKRREPYLFPYEVQNIIRQAIELRYKHIPYWYTLFYEHNLYGDPIISPLFYRYPGIQERDTQILIGENIMAVSVVNSSVKTVEVLFPGSVDELWYRIDRNVMKPEIYHGRQVEAVEVDIRTSPVFYRSGSIIINYESVKSSTFQMHDDMFVGYINLDNNGLAKGRFYVDDYTSFNYFKNEFLYYEVSYNHTNRRASFKLLDGEYKLHIVNFKAIVILSPGKTNLVEQVVFQRTSNGSFLKDIPITENTSFILSEVEEDT